jgi:DNA-binding MarR family transcriptional regulator
MTTRAGSTDASRAPAAFAAEDRLSFLLARHGRMMTARIRQALAVSDLSPRHVAVLTRLDRAGATGQQTLIEELAIDASALVATLNDLESAGLAERRRDPADRRRHIVDITPAGKRAVHAVDTAIAEVEQEAFADLDPADVQRLRMLLCRVRSRTAGDADVC